MFVRTGITPRMAKRMLTTNEANDFLRYCQRFPIDDESNHHVPTGQIAMILANVNRDSTSQPYTLDQFLIYRPTEDPNIDDLLLNGDW